MGLSRRTFSGSLAGLFAAGAAPAFAVDAPDWPNLFIAPMGKPFRAKPGAPYPVVDWFKQADKDGDGKIDHGEFIADASAFFDVLDVNHDGILGTYEVVAYERVIAPEILGLKPSATGDLRGAPTAPGHGGAKLWLAQYTGGSGMSNVPVNLGPPPSADASPVEMPPQGAAPFSLLDVPEPLAAADVDFSGVITKANFLKVANRRFNTLDTAQDGYLVLAKLPKTYVQMKLERIHKGFHP
jgi:EF hand